MKMPHTYKVGDKLYFKRQFRREKHGEIATVTGIQWVEHIGNWVSPVEILIDLVTDNGTELQWPTRIVRRELMLLR